MTDVEIRTPQAILSTAHTAISYAMKKYVKNGIELEKGAIFTQSRIDKNRDLLEKYFNFWSIYPDCFIDFITPSTSHFKLYFYQRMFLRAIMRYGRICVIAPRAFSKSFISILGLYLMCIFRPGIKLFICAPGKAQSAKIAREKLYEIWELLPLLKKEIIGEGNFGADYAKITFRNGSIFDVVSPLNSTRGGRRAAGILDEYRKIA